MIIVQIKCTLLDRPVNAQSGIQGVEYIRLSGIVVSN